ncbi:MAG TPA: hypothetical protein VF463_14640 [Sphingobium sp.]
MHDLLPDDTDSSLDTGTSGFPALRIYQTGEASRGRMAQLDPALIEAFSQRLDEPTAKHAMAALGISIRTWDKLKRGEPVRASLAERVVQRLAREG